MIKINLLYQFENFKANLASVCGASVAVLKLRATRVEYIKSDGGEISRQAG